MFKWKIVKKIKTLGCNTFYSTREYYILGSFKTVIIKNMFTPRKFIAKLIDNL